jgi:RNA polymerase sigma factor (sigma-70 family)
VHRGDQQAIAPLVAECSPRLLEVIRRTIDEDIRRVVDSEDILQNVWQYLFTHELPRHQFNDGQEMLRFLKAAARHKTQDANRRYLDGKRSVRRTTSFERLQQFVIKTLADHHATAAAKVEAEDEFEAFLRMQPPRHRRILTMRRDGYTHEEIANAVGCTERTVSRVLGHFQQAR